MRILTPWSEKSKRRAQLPLRSVRLVCPRLYDNIYQVLRAREQSTSDHWLWLFYVDRGAKGVEHASLPLLGQTKVTALLSTDTGDTRGA